MFTADARIRDVYGIQEAAGRLIDPVIYEDRFGVVNDPDWSTLTHNVGAFADVLLRPRVLMGNESRSTRTTVLGHEISVPFIAAPVGTVDEFCEDGEVPVARAAAHSGSIAVNPCLCDVSIDVIAQAGPVWEQLWIFRDRRYTEHLAKTAEQSGALALVLTVSNVGAPWWRTDRLMNSSAGAQNLMTGVPSPALAGMPGAGPHPSRGEMYNSIDPGAGWRDVEWLAGLTGLPVVIKGVQTAEDVQCAIDHGASGVVVSNHGGRFLQGAVGTLHALPEVAAAAGTSIEVYLDGGVRSGVDILKAIALGARAVLLGRPVLWAAMIDGERGVTDLFAIMKHELEAAMGLVALADIRDADRTLVTPRSVAERFGF